MKVVLCHSGGLDSSVCLLKALASGVDVLSLGFDYGQKAKVELNFAERLCEKHRVPRQLRRIDLRKPQRVIARDREMTEIRAAPTSSFLPARNAIFLSLALAEAISENADEIWTGLNYRDSPMYPDCRPEFLESFQSMAKLATNSDLVIRAPLIDLRKPEIADLGRQYGLTPSDVWSCYRPTLIGGQPKPCQRCDGCIVSIHAWGIGN